ncbi:hypothetical protein ACU686_26285 [Yinghuangia aomiensis]
MAGLFARMAAAGTACWSRMSGPSDYAALVAIAYLMMASGSTEVHREHPPPGRPDEPLPPDGERHAVAAVRGRLASGNCGRRTWPRAGAASSPWRPSTRARATATTGARSTRCPGRAPALPGCPVRAHRGSSRTTRFRRSIRV